MRRLVDQQHGRRREQGPCHREPLLHAVRVGADRAPRSVGEADVVEQLLGPCARLTVAHAVQAGEEGEVLEA